MNDIKDIIYKLLVSLSDCGELSMPRLIKSLYLYDWSATLNAQHKDPRLNWMLSMCGPSCALVEEVIDKNPNLFRRFQKDNHIGGMKEMVAARRDGYLPALSSVVERAVDHVVRVTKGLRWTELSQLIASTMPIVMASVGGALDLENAARVRKSGIAKKSISKEGQAGA